MSIEVRGRVTTYNLVFEGDKPGSMAHNDKFSRRLLLHEEGLCSLPTVCIIPDMATHSLTHSLTHITFNYKKLAES